MKNLYVNVALPVPVNKLFTYIVPDELRDDVAVGKRVIVPFGEQELTGIIVEVSTQSGWHRLKEIKDVLDQVPAFSEEMLKLTKWVADYYLASWGEVLKTALPAGTVLESRSIVRLRRQLEPEVLSNMEKSSPKKAEVLKFLISQNSPVAIKTLKNKFHFKNIYSILHSLESLGYIEIERYLPEQKAKIKFEKFVSISKSYADNSKKLTQVIEELEKTSPKQVEILLFLLARLKKGESEVLLSDLLRVTGASMQTVKKLAERGLIEIYKKEAIRKFEYEFDEPDKKFELNEYQKKALIEIKKAIDSESFKTFLLYGVTGSGKTQIYIEAIKEIIKLGKTAIVLVPEISLTPQIVNRFKKSFGDIVGVLHSRMSIGERYDSWRMIKNGVYKIVIGPRSAIFAPLDKIGLIVVDEEQESSYKQFDLPPRYNARDVAIMRGRINNAVVILGSATPSLESYYNAKLGKYHLLVLPERVDNAKLPKIEVVDMIKERKEHANKTSISTLLTQKIDERISRGEGIIIFQNRRGYSTYIECQDCGYVEMCDNCSVTLIFHKAGNHLRCHYCGFVKSVPEKCRRCGGIKLKLKGVGTQRVEDELAQIFSSAKIIRMDLDTTMGKKSYDKIMQRFANGEADILLGTQMVAKGLDFSRVTLVGVISADIPMLIPDFRSSERTFQLLTQVAGRAGRSEKEGEVIIQTFQPDHYIFNYVVEHKTLEFYERELKIRKELNYPPFTRLILIEFKGRNEKNVELASDEFAKELRSKVHLPVQILGPAPAAIPKINQNYRYHIIMKIPKNVDKTGGEIAGIIWQLKEKFEVKLNSKGVKLIIDVDPQNTV
ncbi:replication restart DNA helicase PriA [Candidatus Kryptobacter tengchongensis]|nr:replication restart DNA helicase PriA [Candidatus Kryptobacter tengchongensis]